MDNTNLATILYAFKNLRVECQQSRRYIDISNNEGYESYCSTANAVNLADDAIKLLEEQLERNRSL